MKTPFRSDPFIFGSLVPEAGFEWQKGIDDQARLASRADIGDLLQIKEPLKNSGLFIEFANLSPTKDAIRQFANTWGNLFNKFGEKDWIPGACLPKGGTSLQLWKNAIGQMRVLLNLWEAIKDHKQRHTELKKIIVWYKGGVRYSLSYPHGSSDAWIAAPELRPELLRTFVPGDVVWPAKYALQQEINARLSDPALVTAPQLIWTEDRDQRIILMPGGLLAAMWLQFAQAVTEEFQLKICLGCRKYFQIGPGGRRVDATTCSDACRQRKRRN